MDWHFKQSVSRSMVSLRIVGEAQAILVPSQAAAFLWRSTPEKEAGSFMSNRELL